MTRDILIALAILAATVGTQLAHANPFLPEYEYVCEEGQYTPGIVCTLREIFHPTQAPWDPKPGQTLMDQIPNPEGHALDVCCGHDPANCKPHQSDRC